MEFCKIDPRWKKKVTKDTRIKTNVSMNVETMWNPIYVGKSRCQLSHAG
jgi:hypothetical protein